jgi:hypothetical protein
MDDATFNATVVHAFEFGLGLGLGIVLLLWLIEGGRWVVKNLLKLDLWTNWRLLNGWVRETISSRCGKAQLRRFYARPEKGDWLWLALGGIVDVLFLWDGGLHCLKSIQYDQGRPAIPAMPDLRWPGLGAVTA